VIQVRTSCPYFGKLSPLIPTFQTVNSYLVLVTVEYTPGGAVYQSPSQTTNARRHFLTGPGEGIPLQFISLRFEGVVRVEGGVLR
jgi:RAB6A-GEF complex partner protein 1